MRVTIVDVEWYSRIRFVPNEWCMRISSYHKQLGDIINFATDKFTLKLDFDLMYMVREDIMTPLPDIDMLDERLRLYGRGFKFYSRYSKELDDIILACRPDYLLYPLREENVQINANFVHFFGNDNKLLPKIQDYHNTRRTKREIIVTDKDFWKHSDEEIAECFKWLKDDFSVSFQTPIYLDDIIASPQKTEMFWQIHLKWEANTVYVDVSNQQKLNFFIKYLRQNCKRQIITPKFITHIKYGASHFEHDKQPFMDFAFYMRAMDLFKKEKIWMIFIAPPRLESPFWFHFEDLEAWSTNQHLLSFIDFMCRYRGRIKVWDLKDYLSNSLLWTDDATQRLMSLWRNYPELMEQVAHREWGDRFDEIRMANYVTGKRIRKIGE